MIRPFAPYCHLDRLMFNPFSSRSDVGVRTRVYIVLSVLLILFFLVQVSIFYTWFHQSKEHELNANLELSRAVAKAFDNWFDGILESELATGLAITSYPQKSQAELNRLLRKIQASDPTTRAVFWMNPEGKVVASSLPSYLGFDFSDRSYFTKVAEGQEWFISELIVGRATGKPSFAISRAVRADNGDLLGVLAASIEPDNLDLPLGFPRSSKGAGISLIDNMGMHVYRFPHTEYTWEQRNWKGYREVLSALHGEEATGRVRSIEKGKWRIVAAVPIPSVGWVVSCSRYEDEITAAILKNLFPQIAFMTLLTVAVFGLAAGLVRPITKSITELHDHVVKVSGGDYAHIPVTGPRELKAFASALNHMSDAVHSREDSLRQSDRR